MFRNTLAAIGLSAGTAVTLSLTGGAVASAAPTTPVAPATSGPAPVLGAAAPAVAPGAAVGSAGLDALVRPLAGHPRRVRTTVVRPGDGFWSIAERTHVNWEDLARTNAMTLASPLYAGEVLRLPDETTSSPTSGATGAVSAAVSPSAGSPASGSPASGSSPAAAASTPAAAPDSAGSVTPGSSFEACVIQRESDGDPQVRSASGYWGLYQFSYATWVAYGGSPAAFGSAGPAAQQAVFDQAMAEGGASNWAPYDGC